MYSCPGTDEASSHPLWLLRLSSCTGRCFSSDMTCLLTIATESSSRSGRSHETTPLDHLAEHVDAGERIHVSSASRQVHGA